jgi:hypothetical protein
LPNTSLITYPAKTADMISISSKGLCGEDGFRRLRKKEARTQGGKKGVLQVKSEDMIRIV